MDDPIYGKVLVRDHALWFAHINGNAQLLSHLQKLRAGEEITLDVDGVRGDWVRLADGVDGRATRALRPISLQAIAHWHSLQDRRGLAVSIAIVERSTMTDGNSISPMQGQHSEEDVLDAIKKTGDENEKHFLVTSTPFSSDSDTFLVSVTPRGNAAPVAGDLIFLWFSETLGGAGLALRGRIAATDDGIPTAILVETISRLTMGLSGANLALGDDAVSRPIIDGLMAKVLVDRAVSELSPEEHRFLAAKFDEARHRSIPSQKVSKRTARAALPYSMVPDADVTAVWAKIYEIADREYAVLEMKPPGEKGLGSNWVIFKIDLPPRVTIDWKIGKGVVELSFWQGAFPQIESSADLSVLGWDGGSPAMFVQNGQTRALQIRLSSRTAKMTQLQDDQIREALSVSALLYRFYCDVAPWVPRTER